MNIAGDLQLFSKGFLLELFGHQFFILDRNDDDIAQRLNETNPVFILVALIVFIKSAYEYKGERVLLMCNRNNDIELSEFTLLEIPEVCDVLDGFEFRQ